MKNILRKSLVVLFILAGLGIIFVAVYYLVSASNRDISFVIRLVLSLLMGLDALGYLLVAWGLSKNISWIYPFALVLLIINVLALFFDDIGWADISAILFNILFGVLLIIDKKHK